MAIDSRGGAEDAEEKHIIHRMNAVLRSSMERSRVIKGGARPPRTRWTIRGLLEELVPPAG